jgi:hypothetical protein
VPIERFTVGGVGSGEGRSRDSAGISLPLEALIEIGVVNDPQADAHANPVGITTDMPCAASKTSPIGTDEAMGPGVTGHWRDDAHLRRLGSWWLAKRTGGVLGRRKIGDAVLESTPE